MASATSPVPPSGSSAGSNNGDDLDFVSNQFESIDIQSEAGSFNLNAAVFVPKTNLNLAASEFVPGFGIDPGSTDTETDEFVQGEVAQQVKNVFFFFLGLYYKRIERKYNFLILVFVWSKILEIVLW